MFNFKAKLLSHSVIYLRSSGTIAGNHLILYTLFITLLSLSCYSQKIVINEGRFSLIHTNGDTILEPIYDSIYSLSQLRNNSFKSNFFVFRKKDKLGFIIILDSLNKGEEYFSKWVKSDLIYDNVYWDGSLSHKAQYVTSQDKYRSIVIVELEGRKGFIVLNWLKKRDYYGRLNIIGIKSYELIEPKYDDIIVDLYPLLILNNKQGLYFSKGKILEPVFDKIEKNNHLGLHYFVWQDGKCGVIHNEKLVLPIRYNKDNLDIEDTIIYIRTKDEPFEIFNVLDSTFVSIRINNSRLLNSDKYHIYAEEIRLDNERFFRINIYDVDKIQKLDSNLNVANRILLANSKKHTFLEGGFD